MATGGFSTTPPYELCRLQAVENRGCAALAVAVTAGVALTSSCSAFAPSAALGAAAPPAFTSPVGFRLLGTPALAGCSARRTAAVSGSSNRRLSVGAACVVGAAGAAGRRGKRRVVAVSRRVAATIDKPPPTAGLDEGDGEEGYEVRYLTNEEREYHAQLWLPMATDEVRVCLEERVLPFRSNTAYVGKSRLCIGVFLNDRCEGMATTEIAPDLSDLVAFIVQARLMRCLAIATRPRVSSEAAEALLSAVKQLADQRGYKTDFEPIKDLAGGRYYVYARSL